MTQSLKTSPTLITEQDSEGAKATPSEPETVSWLAIPDESTLPPDIQELFDEQRQHIGFVHPYFKGFSLIPEHLWLWFQYYNVLMYGPGELSIQEREVIAIISSDTNRCTSCVTTHKAHLREVTGDSVFPDRLVNERHELTLTAREQALVDFAIRISKLTEDLTPEDLKPLRDAGLSDCAILEAAEIATQFGLSNRLTKAFGWKVGSEYDRLFR